MNGEKHFYEFHLNNTNLNKNAFYNTDFITKGLFISYNPL